MSFPSTRSAKWVWSRARAVRPGPSHARDERFNKKIEYIRYNQVRAGLARKPDQWAHVHFHDWVGKEPVGGGPGRTVLVRLRMHINSGVKVPIGQSTGCP
jgi:hypothetical protein